MARHDRENSWYCVESPEERQYGDDVKFVWLSAINNGCNKVFEVTCNFEDAKLCTELLKVKRGQFFALSGVRQGQAGRSSDDIRISSVLGCKVFCFGSEFDFPKSILDNYRNPEMVSTSNVQSSPLKRRVAVKGIVCGMTEQRGSSPRKRVKEIEIKDEKGSVKVCLWRDKAGLEINEGEEISIGPLTVCFDKRSNVKKLNSVSDTTVNRTKYWTCTVVATSDPKEQPIDLLLCGGGAVTIERTYGVCFDKLPLTILIEREGTEIVNISVSDLTDVEDSEADV